MNDSLKKIVVILLLLLWVSVGIYIVLRNNKGQNQADDFSTDRTTQDTTLSPQELTLEEDSRLFSPYQVSVAGPGVMLVAPGTSAVYEYTVNNLGDNDDVYSLKASSTQGWAEVNDIPSSISLRSGKSHSIKIQINIPTNTIAGTEDEFKLIATSRGSPRIFDVATTRTKVAA